MGDRNPSFFGPVLPVAEDAPPAFGPSELSRILATRMEADAVRTHDAAWPEKPRFAMMLPPPPPAVRLIAAAPDYVRA